MRDIYVALGSPEPFAMGNRTESPGCLVEQAVNVALADTFGEAARLLLERFRAVTVPGVMAAGDITREMYNATFATADGVMAGAPAHRELVLGPL